MKKTIAIDFDGVIHSYISGFVRGGAVFDPPNPGAIDSLHKLDKKGFKIVIFTARTDFGPIIEWLRQYWPADSTMEIPEVTNIKPAAFAYIDDRAIRFTNWIDILNYF